MSKTSIDQQFSHLNGRIGSYKNGPDQVVEHLPRPNPIPRLSRRWAAMQSTEKWLPVVGYEGIYEVSDLGRVRSLDRVLPDGRSWAGRLMRVSAPEGRYSQVFLRNRGSDRMASVHRLVLEAFVGPCPEGYEGCHANGDSLDNRAVNLYWGTPAENLRDRYAHGAIAEGVRNGGAKLTPDEVRQIRSSAESGDSQRAIAARFGVSQSTVWRALNTHWKSVA